MNANDQNHRAILKSIAHRAMLERGLLPDFSSEALAELGRLQVPAVTKVGSVESSPGIRDMRNLLWASIDNDDSRDLDQLTVAEALPGDKVKILVAIADVDSALKMDQRLTNTHAITPPRFIPLPRYFPMLPEKISTDITSLNFNEDRLSIVVEMVIGADGSLQEFNIYRAWVRNHAKLAYNSVAAWLEKKGAIPKRLLPCKVLAENLQLQDRAAQRMKNFTAYPWGAQSGNH